LQETERLTKEPGAKICSTNLPHLLGATRIPDQYFRALLVGLQRPVLARYPNRTTSDISRFLLKVRHWTPDPYRHNVGAALWPAQSSGALWLAEAVTYNQRRAAGPTSSPFEGGVFHLELFLTEDYPMAPPKVRGG
jgi:hypothetical protein